MLPDLPPFTYWLSGLVAALLLFVSVLLHELSHALVACAHGLRVHGITLHVFGGVSHLGGEPPSPRAEFLIAVVGPLTNFGIAAFRALERASGNGIGRLAVLDGRRLVGYLSLKDIMHVLALRGLTRAAAREAERVPGVRTLRRAA